MTIGLTPTQCAKALGVSKDQVLALIAAGELNAFSVGLGKQRKRYRVEESELAAFKQRRSAKPVQPTARRSSKAYSPRW